MPLPRLATLIIAPVVSMRWYLKPGRPESLRAASERVMPAMLGAANLPVQVFRTAAGVRASPTPSPSAAANPVAGLRLAPSAIPLVRPMPGIVRVGAGC